MQTDGRGWHGALEQSFFLLQLTNFSLVPVHWRTAYTGLCGFLWATFLCFSQQSGDGTVKSAFAFLHVKEASALERSPKEWEAKDSLAMPISSIPSFSLPSFPPPFLPPFRPCSGLPKDNRVYLPVPCSILETDSHIDPIVSLSMST